VAQTQGKDAAEAWYTTKDLDWWDKARTQTWQQAYAEMVRSFFGAPPPPSMSRGPGVSAKPSLRRATLCLW
jgi:hypothetical protein